MRQWSVAVALAVLVGLVATSTVVAAGLQRIEATSTNPNAILGVYLTVRSNFGGSASASTA